MKNRLFTSCDIVSTLPKKSPNRHIALAVKLVATSVFLYWALTLIDFSILKATIKNIDLKYLGFAFFIHALAFILMSTRWWVLYHARDNNTLYTKALGGYYLGLFFNNFLPTGMGGDLVRIITLRNEGFDTTALVSSTLLDRILGLISILLMGLVALFVSPKIQISNNFNFLLIVIITVIPLIFILLFSRRCNDLLLKLTVKVGTNRFTGFIRSVLLALHEYRQNRTQLLLAICISLLAQHLIILSYIFIGLGLDIDLATYIYFAIIPIVFITSSLPISIGGLGVREGTLIAFFTMYGVVMESAVALSLVYFAVLVMITLPGGLLILKRKIVDIDDSDSVAPTAKP